MLEKAAEATTAIIGEYLFCISLSDWFVFVK